MNIDLRNISPEFENQVNEVKKRFYVNTNSKAVELCVANYFIKLKEIENLKNELDKANRDLRIAENKINNMQIAFRGIME